MLLPANLKWTLENNRQIDETSNEPHIFQFNGISNTRQRTTSF